jgi:RNA polymerase sigma-70 factor, ECF subfamily
MAACAEVASIVAAVIGTYGRLFPSAIRDSPHETVLERIAQGDQRAMRMLYAKHHVMIYRFIVRMVRNPTAAEDIVSDVFLDVWRKAAQFEGRSAESTWLLAIARFKALSWLRGQREGELEDSAAAAVPDPAVNPEMALQNKERSELLRSSIAQLPAAQAEIIDLVYYHDKSVAEVAEIAHIPEATVKTRMFYARRKLAELVTLETSKSSLCGSFEG